MLINTKINKLQWQAVIYVIKKIIKNKKYIILVLGKLFIKTKNTIKTFPAYI